MRNQSKKVYRFTARIGAKALALQMNCKEKLASKKGNEIVTIIVIIAMILVIAVVVFFPQLRDLVDGAFDNADSKMDEIWNYKG